MAYRSKQRAHRYNVVAPHHQVGESDFYRDVVIRAKLPGKRVSKIRKNVHGRIIGGGAVYYENRANRSDVDPKMRL